MLKARLKNWKDQYQYQNDKTKTNSVICQITWPYSWEWRQRYLLGATRQNVFI